MFLTLSQLLAECRSFPRANDVKKIFIKRINEQKDSFYFQDSLFLEITQGFLQKVIFRETFVEEQECIPVGCVPPACIPACTGQGDVCPDRHL